MKEETYGCDTHVCRMDGYMVGYRVKELDASDIGDDLIYAVTKHLGIPVVLLGGYATYNIGHTDDYGDIDVWTLWPNNVYDRCPKTVVEYKVVQALECKSDSIQLVPECTKYQSV